MMMNQYASLLLLLLQAAPLNGWVTTSLTPSRTLSPSAILPPGVTIAAPASTTTSLEMAGFGADDKSKKKKETKLKPKQQWDRFGDLKKEDKIRVAVKVVDSDSGDWLEVGFVRSAENAYTDFAVARQRSLIIEHARRLFPLQVSLKDTVQWAYFNADSEEWVIAEKAIVDNATDLPVDVEKGKAIGFEGLADPSSGFYCCYSEGRLVNSASDVKAASKKLE